jgi:exodeoxyribonuclease VII large subunit
VHGRVSFYTARGDLQLYADSVTPEGLGALQQAFKELKRRLGAEGLFDPSRKRNLPKFPQKLALITSPDGSVIHDVLNVLRRRYPLVEVTVVPTAVQGAAAADGIVDALCVVDRRANFDVAIVTRGGGSLEDLWPFNEERVARAIYASRTPIISAVGHETDFTIADLVADARAPTPSTAAELVAPDQTEIATDIARMISRAALNVEHSFGERHVELELATDRLLTRSPNIVGGRSDVDELLRVARLAMNHFIERYKRQIEMLQTAISALGPEKILARGYAIVRLSESSQVVRDVTSITPGDQLNITLAKGEIEAITKSSRQVRDA